MKLPSLCDPHCALHILRSCLTTCRVNHVLRCARPEALSTVAPNFDAMQAEAFEAITGVPLSGHASTQARLPLRYGGLGMSSCESIRLDAFVASFFFAMSRARTLLQMHPDLLLASTSISTALHDLRPLLAEVPTTLQEFIAGMNVDEPLHFDPPKDWMSQRFWNHSVTHKELSSLLSALPSALARGMQTHVFVQVNQLCLVCPPLTCSGAVVQCC